MRGEDAAAAEAGADSTGTAGTAGAKTGDEKRAGLDEDLDESLREFDEILLREQEALEERHEATATASAGRGSSSASSRGRDRGAETGVEEGRDEAELGGTGASPDTPPNEPGIENGTGGPITEPGTGDVPDDVGDGADDDIVARQLREAAMNEEDPELREKLWDEYRAYKAGLKK